MGGSRLHLFGGDAHPHPSPGTGMLIRYMHVPLVHGIWYMASAAMYQAGSGQSRPTFKGIPFETAQKHASTGRPAVKKLVHWYMQCTKFVGAMYQALRYVSIGFPLVSFPPLRPLAASRGNVGTLVHWLRRLDLVFQLQTLSRPTTPHRGPGKDGTLVHWPCRHVPSQAGAMYQLSEAV